MDGEYEAGWSCISCGVKCCSRMTMECRACKDKRIYGIEYGENNRNKSK